MQIGRIVVGLVVIVGLAAVFKGFWTDLEESKPPPRLYQLFADSRITADQTGMQVTNGNDFSWTRPNFIINGGYRYKYPGSVKAGEVVTVPFAEFKQDDGTSFPGVAQFHNFDIATATMSLAKRR